MTFTLPRLSHIPADFSLPDIPPLLHSCCPVPKAFGTGRQRQKTKPGLQPNLFRPDPAPARYRDKSWQRGNPRDNSSFANPMTMLATPGF